MQYVELLKNIYNAVDGAFYDAINFHVEKMTMEIKPTYEDLERKIDELEEEVDKQKHAENNILEENYFCKAIIENASEGLSVCHEIIEYPFVRCK